MPALLAKLLLFALVAAQDDPIGTVLLDIEEDKDGRFTQQLRIHFRKAGYRVVATRKTRWDEKKKDEVVDKKKARDVKADFIVRGSVKAKHDRTAKFYDHVIAYVYKGYVDLDVRSGDKSIKKFKFDDETGGDTHEEGKRDIHDMVARFIGADALRLPPIKKRISKEALKELKVLFEGADEERREE